MISRSVFALKLIVRPVAAAQVSGIHTTCRVNGVREPGQNKIIKAHSQYYEDFWSRDMEGWSDMNNTLYPPSRPGEPHRPAEIYHGRALIRHSPKKMWYASKIILNMNVDEAIAQLGFVNSKACDIISEVLLEAQEMAVQDHNVEFKSNLHVVRSLVEPAGCRKIIRYHGKGYAHMNRSRFSNFYLMIREGRPLEGVSNPDQITAYGAAVEYLNDLRMRTIQDGL